MPVPLLAWSTWMDALPALAPHRAALDEAFARLRTERPARRAYWSDEFVWALGTVGLDAAVAEALRAEVEPAPGVRVALHDEPQGAPPAPAAPGVASILLASSPRAGNTILRRLVGELGFAEYAVHDLDDEFWSHANRPFVVQHHAPPGPSTDEFVAREQAGVLTIVRHPVDVLCSVRQFAQRTPAARFWLHGDVDLGGADLASDAGFVRWATSDGADRLLAVSTAWAARPDVLVVRYEELAADPAATVRTLADRFGVPAGDARAVDERVAGAEGSIPDAHRTAGGPGAWRDLPAAVLEPLVERHAGHLGALGYGT